MINSLNGTILKFYFLVSTLAFLDTKNQKDFKNYNPYNSKILNQDNLELNFSENVLSKINSASSAIPVFPEDESLLKNSLSKNLQTERVNINSSFEQINKRVDKNAHPIKDGNTEQELNVSAKSTYFINKIILNGNYQTYIDDDKKNWTNYTKKNKNFTYFLNQLPAYQYSKSLLSFAVNKVNKEKKKTKRESRKENEEPISHWDPNTTSVPVKFQSQEENELLQFTSTELDTRHQLHVHDFWDASLQFPEEGCSCWDTVDDSHNREVECTCSGENFSAVPKNLSSNVLRITISNAGIRKLENDSFYKYRGSLQEIVVNNVPDLEVLESGIFDGLLILRSVYIHSAPKLKQLPSFHLSRMPKLIILRVISSGLMELPEIATTSDHILQMVDFENNRIKKVKTRSVGLRAHQMIFNFNLIKEVEKEAFYGSEIGQLSFKGNSELQIIHDDTFKGIIGLRTLDLSGTSISVLPTVGIENHLENLFLVDTFTLRKFPSVYSFKAISSAHLTYPYHCCAFQFPEQQYPEEYQKMVKELEETHCSQMSSTVAPTEGTHNGLKREVPFEKPGTWHGHVIHHKKENNLRLRHFTQGKTPLWQRIKKRSGLVVHGFNSSMASSNAFNSVLSGTNETSILFERSIIPNWNQISHHDILGLTSGTFGSLPNSDTNGASTDQRKEDKSPLNWAAPVNVNTTLVVFCGNISKNYRDVVCHPLPDAFNPCEDIMGNLALRVAVWIVVVTAVVGNLAVMIVLMSSKFRMTVSKFLMINLALADLCMGIYLLLIASMDLHTIGVYFNYAIDWQNGPGCKIAGFLTVFASELSIFTLTVITSERWYAITYAIHLNKRLRLPLAAKIMVLGWLYSVTMAILPLVGVSDYSKTSICLPMETKGALALTYLVTLLIVNGLAFIVISACYASMYCSISQHDAATTNNDLTVAKRMALLVFTDFACWAPIAFFGLTAVLGVPLIDVTRAKILLVFFYPLNSCANPYLYAILTKQYRRDLFILLAKYGFCTKRAMRYKGAYSSVNNTIPQHTIPLHCRPLHRNSTLTQITLCDFSRGVQRLTSQSNNGSAAVSVVPEGSQDSLQKSVSPLRITTQPEIYAAFGDRLSTVQEMSHCTQSDEGDDVDEKLDSATTTKPSHVQVECNPFYSSEGENEIKTKQIGSPHPLKSCYTKSHFTDEHENLLHTVTRESKLGLRKRSLSQEFLATGDHYIDPDVVRVRSASGQYLHLEPDNVFIF